MSATELQQLRCFIALAEERSMERAGARLGIAASDVAVTVMALERSLDVALIALGPGGVELTATGRRFLRTARALAEPRDLTHDVDVDPDDAPPSSP